MISRPILVISLLAIANAALATWPTLPNCPLDLTDTGGQKHDVIMVDDGQDGAFILWHDTPPSANGVMVGQHIDSNGDALWVDDGRTLITSSGELRDYTVLADESGGFFMAWVRGSDVFGFTLEVIHRNSSGNQYALSSEMMDLGTSTNDPYVQLVNDGAGGAYVGWIWDFDLYLTRVDATASPTWQAPLVIYDGSYATEPACLVMAQTSNGNVLLGYNIYIDMIGYMATLDLRNDNGTSLWSEEGPLFSLFSSATTLPNGDAAVVCGHYANIIQAGGGLVSTDWVDVFPAHNLQPTRACATPDGGMTIAVIGTYNGQEIVGLQYIDSSLTRHWGAAGVTQILPEAASEMDLVAHADGSLTAVMQGASTTVAARFTLYGGPAWASPVVLYDISPGSELSAVAGRTGDVLAAWQSDDEVRIGQLDPMGWPADNRPVLTNVLDHPGDQGGVCLVDWNPALRDNLADRLITRYTLWRRLSSKSTSKTMESTTGLVDLPSSVLIMLNDKGWDCVGTTEAWALDSYTDTGLSFGDSTSSGIPLTEFMVMAHSTTDGPFWYSDVLSGWSVDNLTPSAPLELMASQESPSVLINWLPGDSNDIDLAYYNIYASEADNITVDPSLLSGTTEELEFTLQGCTLPCHIAVTAVDIHGNESGLSNEIAVGLMTPVGHTPDNTLALLGASPNPFNPRTTLSFTLPTTTHMDLEIYNISGQLVRSVVSGVYEAGTYTMIWDGNNGRGLPSGSGVYFAVLKAAGDQKNIKLMLVK